MKVLHVIDSGGLYGAEILLLNLVGEQVKFGLSPVIGSIGEKDIREKAVEGKARERGFVVRKFRMRAGPNLKGALEILGYAQKENFDLIHSHGYKGNILLGFIPRFGRKMPLVATLHGWTSTRRFSKMGAYEWLDAQSLRFIDAVVLVNRGMLSNPRLKRVRGVKFHVVNNGISCRDEGAACGVENVGALENEKVRPWNVPTSERSNLRGVPRSDRPTFPPSEAFDTKIADFCAKRFTIGSIGRLSDEKGYNYLIQALDILVKDGLDARLVIIGEGPERFWLEKLVEGLGIADRALLPGYRENAKRYLPLFRVFVLSSLTEGLPITLLEAMQAKVPIVATRVGGIPDALRDELEGLLVEPRDPAGLAEGIRRVDDGILTSKIVAGARRRFEERFCGARMASEYLKIYEDVVKDFMR